MANVQRYFEEFHETIHADYDMNEELREKRNAILERVRVHLKEKELPGFQEIMQGSYAMGTGIKPIGKLKCDIDVGLCFNLSESDHSAGIVRGWVYNAVMSHTEEVENKNSCIRVKYKGELFHVDLVSYARWKDGRGEQVRLAHKTGGWRHANPEGFKEYIASAREKFKGTEDSKTEADQFRRIVRYIKRWDDAANPAEADNKPSGLAFTLLSVKLLNPRRSLSGHPDDRAALEAMAANAAQQPGRLIARKPTPEYEDVFAGLSDRDMEKLKARFARLAEMLRKE